MQDYNIAFMKVNLYRKYKENISRKKPSEFNSDKKNNRLAKRSKWAHYKISYMDDET